MRLVFATLSMPNMTPTLQTYLIPNSLALSQGERWRFVEGSRIADIYGATSASEEYHCNFGVNPEKVDLLKSGALRITGANAEGDMRVIELTGHPFFVATLFVP